MVATIAKPSVSNEVDEAVHRSQFIEDPKSDGSIPIMPMISGNCPVEKQQWEAMC